MYKWNPYPSQRLVSEYIHKDLSVDYIQQLGASPMF